jgi:Na+-transporting NADH:ubiquinone oxidoreductase subunit F
MSNVKVGEIPRNDYSLVGKNSGLAVEKGLAGAKWYTSPVPKEKMRELLQRRDGPAIRDTLLWFALLLFFGGFAYLLWGSWWVILPFAIYGILYASVSDSRWHESSHGTAFKTDWMNNALYELASFMVLRESVHWRWSHTRHHSDTIIVGRDPEIVVQRPANLFSLFVLNAFDVNALKMYVNNVALHVTGRLTPEELTYIPESEHKKLFIRARVYVLIYAALIAFAIYTRSILPLMFVGLPNLYGSWWMLIYGYTQHAALAEDVLDHRLNCRTVYMNRLNRYLYWNMGYHVEHHMFPLVPYHALPKLHELVKADMPVAYKGLLEAHREIIPALVRQSKDATYFVKRHPPTPSTVVGEDIQLGTIVERRVVDGWLEVSEHIALENEDVLRFDHEQKTYALYRGADSKYYATDGLCTHGNTHLADGLVKGTIIECAKHNGRFDFRDGSPQRLPVCVGLKTYPVRERDGKIWVDLRVAGGYGVTSAAVTHTFRVASNRNVATFVKELVLVPLEGAFLPEYQPGDYMQLDIPAYPRRSLKDVQVSEPFIAAWQAQDVFGLTAANPTPGRRNYSLATNPAIDGYLSFNVRLALPPRGVECDAGTGSSYVFGLKPDDVVTAIGPFGEFHVKETSREMVYLGGGTGMAPIRSHLSWLIETRKITTPVSYWYGARSLQELFYRDYFENLAQGHNNFTFHVALSEPLPEDKWQSYSGFIHEVLQREYLDSHPDPRKIDYFLCGPPVMIKAATHMLAELGVDPGQVSFDEF